MTKITLSESALMELRSRLAQSEKKGVLPWLVWIATATKISSANEKPKAPQEGWGMDLVAPVDGDSRFVRNVNGLEIGANEPILAQKHITELLIDFQDGDFLFNGEPGWRRTRD